MGRRPKDLFVDVFGENATIKVLKYMYGNYTETFSVGQIHDDVELSRQAVYIAVEKLFEKKIIGKVKGYKNIQSYAVNTDSKHFDRLWQILDIAGCI